MAIQQTIKWISGITAGISAIVFGIVKGNERFNLKKQIHRLVKGYKIGLIGRPDSGKSNFLKFWNTTPEKVKFGRIKVSTIKEISGQEEFTEDAKKLVYESHIILYFFNAKLVQENNNKCIKQIVEDSALIKLWLDDLKFKARKPDFIMVGTHSDELLGLDKDSKKIYSDINSKLENVFVSLGTNRKYLLLGNTINEEGLHSIKEKMTELIKGV